MTTTTNRVKSFLDTRQRQFWNIYLSNTSGCYSNAYRSALVAGYTEHSARNITRTDWFISGVTEIRKSFEQINRSRIVSYIEARNNAY